MNDRAIGIGRWAVLLGATAAALTTAGCGSGGANQSESGVAVNIMNNSPWTVQILGCGDCGPAGLGVPTGGSLGWQENRTGLVSYSIKVRGITSPCPALPRATPSPGVVPTYYSEVDYAISTAGVCSVGQVGGHN